MHRVFVFGSLKEGFSNFHINRGRRVGGHFVTVQRYALYIIGAQYLPWLVPPLRPGEGHPVRGQLFEVDDTTLAAMDRLERVDEPLWYRREPIEVQAADDGTPGALPTAAACTAWVYMGNHERLAQETAHVGPVPEYSADLAAAYPLPIKG